MRRTFNYTKRKKILREDVQLAIIRPNDLPEVRVLQLNLNRLSLPVSSQIWFEIETGRVGLARYSLGTIGSIDLNSTYRINERDLGNIRFRIKIVSNEEGDVGKLLAEIDRLRPETDGNVRSLLEVKPSDDLEQRIWKLEISESGPELLINTGLGDWREVGESIIFQSLVFPQAVYEIFKWVGKYSEYPEGSIEEQWKNLFMTTGHDIGQLSTREDFSSDDDFDEYLAIRAHEVAQSFARNHKALNQFLLGRNQY